MPRALLTCLCIAVNSFICIAIWSPVFAQTKQLNLNLEQAINLADTNNPQLVAARSNIPIAQAGLTIAQIRPNPRLTFDYPFGQAETKRTLGIEQIIELGGKRSARIAVAKAQIQQAGLQFNSLQWQIRNQVRQAYAELGIAKGAQQLSIQTVGINRQLVNVAKVRLRVGDVAPADVAQAEFSLQQAQQKLEQTANRVITAQIRLNGLLGQPSNTAINLLDATAFKFSTSSNKDALAPQQQIPALSVLQKTAKTSRVDLALARQQIQLSNNQIRVARASQIPDLTVAATYVWDPGLANTSSPLTTAVILGVRVDLPIFNNGQGAVNQARATLTQSDAQVKALESQINSEVATAYENVTSSQRLLERDRTILLPQALKVLNYAQKSYGYGQTGLSDALVAQQSAQSTFDNFYTDILAYQTALGALEQAVNKPLSQFNQSNVRQTP